MAGDSKRDALKRKVLSGIALVCIVAAALVQANLWINAASVHTGRMEVLNGQIDVVKSHLREVETQQALDEEAAKETIANAGDAGNAVADLQMGYIPLVANVFNDSASVKAQAQRLKQYMAPGEDRAQTPWATQMDVPYEWVFRSSYDVVMTSGNNVIPCVWLCEDKSSGADNRVLAYVLMNYNCDTGKFDSFEYHLTEYGGQHLVVEEDSLGVGNQDPMGSNKRAG